MSPVFSTPALCERRASNVRWPSVRRPRPCRSERTHSDDVAQRNMISRRADHQARSSAMRVASIGLLTAILIGPSSMPGKAASQRLPFPQASARGVGNPRPSFVASQRRDPWGNLFMGQLKVDPKRPSPPKAPSFGQLPAQGSIPSFRVVCGMTLIPADPNIDAGIRHPIPKNGPKFSIQTIPLPPCQR